MATETDELQINWSLVTQLAEGLSPQECLDYFNLNYATLDPETKAKFDIAYKRGKVNMKMYAIRHLKQAMQNSKTGMAASLAALSRFGEDWQVSEQVSKVKSFKITLDDE